MKELNPRPEKVQTMIVQPERPVTGLIALLIGAIANLPWMGPLGFLGVIIGIIGLFKKQFLTSCIAIIFSIFAIVTSAVIWAAGGAYVMYELLQMEPPASMQRPAPDHFPPAQTAPQDKPLPENRSTAAEGTLEL